MLRPAYYYRDALSKAYARCVMEPSHLFWSPESFARYDIAVKDTSWEAEQWVSLDGENVIGYLAAHIDRDCSRVTSLSIARFGDGKVFALDLFHFLRGLSRRFHSIAWSVVIGNPAEQGYDRICQRIGGRIIGHTRCSCRTLDGQLRDQKLYEWVRPASVPIN